MDALARTLTDNAAAANLLAASLPCFQDGTCEIVSCRVMQTRRRISRRLLECGGAWLGVVWRLEVRSIASGAVGEQWLYAKAHTLGTGPAAWQASRAAARVAPRFGAPIAYLPAKELVVWAVPNDPALVRLPTFLDGRALIGHLPPGLDPDPSTRVRAKIVRHEPEEHCTARFEALRDGHVKVFYGKCFGDGRWRDARDGLDMLWLQGARDRQAFLVGQPLGASPALGAIWQAEVAGRPLSEALATANSARVAQLAAALHRFQAEGPRQGRRETFAESIESARKWRKKLVLAEPALADDAAAVLEILAGEPPLDGEAVTVHGDFHIDQMLWTGERIALFDYDSLALGSPCRDLADCVSQLLCREETGPWVEVARRLITAFRKSAPRRMHDEELEWHLRLMLMRKAYSCFVRSRQGWQQAATRALALARAGLASLEGPARRSAA